MSDQEHSLELVRMYDIQQRVQLRRLSSDDVDEVRYLCAQWFPINYPDKWYKEITSNPQFYSLAATINTDIVGFIICDVKPRSRCNPEDRDILSSKFPPSTPVAYILSLGVVKELRRHGIASILLSNLVSYLTAPEQSSCKVVYLHVLDSNRTAILFYERHNFHMHGFLPCYYSIKGRLRDGYSYVTYINGGYPPFSLLDRMKQVCDLISYLKPSLLCQHVVRLITGLCSRLRSRSLGFKGTLHT